MEWLTDNWEWILLAVFVLEKIVKKTPCKWDDILFDMIIDPFIGTVKTRLLGKKDEKN